MTSFDSDLEKDLVTGVINGVGTGQTCILDQYAGENPTGDFGDRTIILEDPNNILHYLEKIVISTHNASIADVPGSEGQEPSNPVQESIAYGFGFTFAGKVFRPGPQRGTPNPLPMPLPDPFTFTYITLANIPLFENTTTRAQSDLVTVNAYTVTFSSDTSGPYPANTVFLPGDAFIYDQQFFSDVPEPTTLSILGVGSVGLMLIRRKKRLN
jgi:hypothetical protein